MSVEERKEMAEEEQKRRLHAQNLQGVPHEDREGETAEILRYLSEIDDLPIDADDPIMGQLASKLTSTANLSAEQVRSNEWVREYLLILYLCTKPTQEGIHGWERACTHDDLEAYREPLSPEDRAQLEAFVSMTKLGLTRSEGMAVAKEATRNVQESIVNESDEGGSTGGIIGRIKS